MQTAIPSDIVAPHSRILVPAHANNYSSATAPVHSGYQSRFKARALVYHTPEEAVDDVEVAPRWFQNPAAGVSTDAYADSDGDLYLMVGDRDSPFANGVTTANRHWKGAAGQRPPWALAGVSLNSQTRSIEIEGYAATMHRTFKVGGPQFQTVVAWATFWTVQDEIPVDRDHHVGHQEIDLRKSDPGIDRGFPIDDLLEALFNATEQFRKMGGVEAMWRGYFAATGRKGHRLTFISDDGRRAQWALSYPSGSEV